MTTQTGEAVGESKSLMTVRDLLIKNKTQIAMALPKHITPERMIRIALTAVQRNPKLLECHPATLGGAVMLCAQWGMEPIGAGGAYLIPFQNRTKNRLEVQVIFDYRGLVSIARNSGDVLKVEPRSVYEKDTFAYEYGTAPRIQHNPYQGKDEPGKLTHVYAVAFYRNGTTQFVVLTLAQVEKYRARSQARTSGPWVTDFEAMALKTSVRVLCKQLPMEPEKQAMIAKDEKGDLGIPQDLGTLVDPTETTTPQDGENPNPTLTPKPIIDTTALPSGNITPEQRKQVFVLCKEHKVGDEALKNYLSAFLGVQETSEVKAEDYDRLVAWIKKPA